MERVNRHQGNHNHLHGKIRHLHDKTHQKPKATHRLNHHPNHRIQANRNIFSAATQNAKRNFLKQQNFVENADTEEENSVLHAEKLALQAHVSVFMMDQNSNKTSKQSNP